MTTQNAAWEGAPEGARLALVTGGSRGLGQALCSVLQTEGYEVLSLSRRAGTHGSIVVDLTDPGLAAATVNERLRAFDLARIKDFIFVNNAATVEPVVRLVRASVPDVLRNLDVNLRSAVAIIACVLAWLEDSTARKVLVNVTSGAAVHAHVGLAAYSAAKAGMEQYIRCVAAEQASLDHPVVAVNVDPGALDTEMQVRLRTADPSSYPSCATMAARHERGELASPDKVAAAIVRLARSDDLEPGAHYRVHDHI